jgi:hypothetical protein
MRLKLKLKLQIGGMIKDQIVSQKKICAQNGVSTLMKEKLMQNLLSKNLLTYMR